MNPVLRASALGSLICALSIFTAAPAAAGFYDDWWLCAAKCVPNSVGEIDCLDACTDAFNGQNAAELDRAPGLRLVPQAADTATPVYPVRKQVGCPARTRLQPAIAPILRAGRDRRPVYQTLWICLPEGASPLR
ncbi:MAG: hypothetical protein AAGI70_07080 [Pseudomonadota bacterium]